MINPGSLAGQMPQDPNEGMVRRIQDLERVVRELQAQDVLRTAGLVAAPNRLTVQGELDVTGPMVVGGTLSLPAGIIGNAALTNPVVPLVSHVGANNFGLATGANIEIVRATITVPAGCSQVLVSTAALMHAYNQNASGDDAYLTVTISGSSIGASSQISCPATAGTALAAHGVGLLSGLGATFYVSAKASSGSLTWNAASYNFVNLDTTLLFLR